jgi:hypothetical protein
MTTNPTAPTVTACPTWCTLTPGHDWDTIALDAADNLMRGHQGPSFGPLTCEGLEVSDGRPLRLTVLGPEEREAEFENGCQPPRPGCQRGRGR